MTPHTLTESAGGAAACASLHSAVPEPGFAVGPVGLSLDATPTRESWERFGAWIGRVSSGHQWLIGDWLLCGEREWGITHEIAEHVSGLAESTLRDCRYVAHRFENPRRRESLSFGHHREVAALPPAEADALLARAESESLSRNQLRDLAVSRRPIVARDPHAERVKATVRATVSLKKLAAALPIPDEARIALEKFLLAVEELDRAGTTIVEADRATAEDLKGGRYGRRV